ncbi:2-amino-4-hydroxy-6-hydroxymethyldihydropteridine diphosphokinase [Marinithermus hydrothermalis]|uniref:2-amino-4-hydroxy-6-hydroxymethyldihydropteridine diphosphokinase n=1 Tax=Marinithermus hydrothermalis (strain DSM 14884 / JCM 11576 / T1) TaxID=869210 RepID=F2NNN2_MARHT|nr:2-amino-4-hydroxy-6-hydroxymethyldihydropteridine diphosphokinase [Marinithermus hydrothermalis]AEB11047.1 2-amino-4-hydroxy-6-hydroxymethyldihydropteridine pyrophosphokinase [Marinithermus hydrothermalis DSM 14884]
MTRTAYVALGSNLGDRAGYLLAALSALGRTENIRLARLSRVYETAPVGPSGQGPYLNLVAEIETRLEPQPLLQTLLGIERRLGRVRRERWGPRTIDLDLLLYADVVLDAEALTLPHPRLHERAFVLAPLCDLIPDAVHPRLGRTYRALLEAVGRVGVRVWRP